MADRFNIEVFIQNIKKINTILKQNLYIIENMKELMQYSNEDTASLDEIKKDIESLDASVSKLSSLGYIQFPSGGLVTTSYDTNEYQIKAPFEMKTSETGEVINTGNFNFKLLIGGSDFISVDLDETDSYLQVKLDQTKVDTEVKEGSTNLITSGGAFKNDPLFFKTDNYLSDLSNTEKEEFNLIIEKSFAENRPIIISCPESFFFQMQSIDSRVYFIGTIDDISQYEMITFYKNEKWDFEYDITLNYSCEFLWSFSEDKNYSINAHVGSINTDLVLKQNELTNAQKMSYIYSMFNSNAIISLSLKFDSKFHKIIEITFSNETDYTFYYLENGEIKSIVIDSSIIQ